MPESEKEKEFCSQSRESCANMENVQQIEWQQASCPHNDKPICVWLSEKESFHLRLFVSFYYQDVTIDAPFSLRLFYYLECIIQQICPYVNVWFNSYRLQQCRFNAKL